MKIEAELARRQEEVEAAIRQYLPEEKHEVGSLTEAMRYSLLVGGKRLRPVLMLESYRLFGGKEATIEPFLAAIEMIHTHSLVHDDLPALDNDLLRRGKQTTHAAYGEALGVLAGDALLNLAYETMLQAFFHREEWQRAYHAGRILSEKSGLYGMLGGQSLDVEKEKVGTRIEDEETLLYIYEKKTGALFEAALMVGAVLAGAEKEDVQRMETIGNRFGLAFQIRDDILDVTASEEEMGKPAHSDEKNEKVTMVSLLGLAMAEQRVAAMTEEALQELRQLPGKTDFLEELFRSLCERTV